LTRRHGLDASRVTLDEVTATPGWYPDPRGTGTLRYFDGESWTEHVALPPPTVVPGWKGARLGRPPLGAGSLANPGRRLAARLLDQLFVLPVLVVLLVVLVVGFAHEIARWTNGPSNQATPIAGIVAFELSVFGIILIFFVFSFLYEALTTVRWGRSPGKAIMKIRPVRLDDTALSVGRAFGRAGAFHVAGFVQLLQILDALWCLWDEDAQCLHDKVCDTLVVSDD
jgi:uncharacterized RDD family membrane protein YckC